MTQEQEKALAEIGEQIKGLFPNMYGSIRFNLAPGRKEVNVNTSIVIEESHKLHSDKQKGTT
jgi:hypothetical protein